MEEAEVRVQQTRERLDACPTEPDDDALLDVHNRFHQITDDTKLTVNAKAKLLLEAVHIHTHPNGEVTIHCIGREDVVIPPLKPGTKPGIGAPPAGYHVIPSAGAHQALLSTMSRYAWAYVNLCISFPELRIPRVY